MLSRGWNWIGHAPLTSFGINSGITAVGSGTFTTDDQIKTRSGNVVIFCTYDGSTFQGGLSSLEPGIGYEVRVHAQTVTFRYTTPSQPPFAAVALAPAAEPLAAAVFAGGALR